MSTEDEDRFWLPLVERRIREAIDRGEFDDLPGAGEPLPDLGLDDDPGWWVRRWVEREHLSDRGRELRRLRGEELLRLRTTRGREAALRRLEQIDAEIAGVENRLGRHGTGIDPGGLDHSSGRIEGSSPSSGEGRS
jgi:hypothetical protein